MKETIKEAFSVYTFFYNEDFEGKPRKPFHLMYNMATGVENTYIGWINAV
jgi:type III restriction enzyme